MNTDLQNKQSTCRKKKTFFPFLTLVSGHSTRLAASDIYAQKHKADTVIIRKVSQNLGKFWVCLNNSAQIQRLIVV